VFDERGILRENCDVESVYFLRQILYLAKRAQIPCSRDDVLQEIEDFVAVDEQLPEPEGFWTAETPDLEAVAEYAGFQRSALYAERISGISDASLADEMSVLLVNLDAVSRLISETLGDYLPSEWRFRHGPGAISEVVGPANKYCWRNWSDRLEAVYPIADCGFHSYSAWAGRATDPGLGSIEPSSRLVAVPKSLKKPRLIAAEPSEHMWCQQNIWNYISTQCRRSWLDGFVRFRDQSLNQELCRRGSEGGELATVDLSAASDRVTCHFVGQMWRHNLPLLFALQSTRTRILCQSIHPGLAGEMRLRKFSTMGSACTFPIQSLAFLAISLAAVATKHRLPVNVRTLKGLVGKVAVFGDDIVVPVDCRVLFTKALEVLHFKINASKTFWAGRFRESCGVDAFRGVSVTPAYWRNLCEREPESIASAVEVRNNFYRRFLLRTAAYLASTIPVGGIPLVSMDSGACGFKTFVRPRFNSKLRWNKDLQRLELRARVFYTRTALTPATDDSGLLQYFTEDPPPFSKWQAGFVQRAKLKHRLRRVPWDDLVS
jgi:hypothetical protein